MAQKNKGFVLGQERYTTIWDNALVIHGKKDEWILVMVVQTAYCAVRVVFER